ncbi:MAG: GNAT family N-acetyltransferase [Bacteroidota bacterium]
MIPIIRKATSEDLPAIFDLVVKLAIYEKEPHAVKTSVEIYQKDFGAGVFEAHVAEYEGAIVGMMIYYLTYSTWRGRMLYLEDFVVRQDKRQLGLGQLLFEALIEEGKKKGARLIKWQVLDWNEPALAFYRKIGATIEKNWWNGKLYLDQGNEAME